jgi:hypothetical protein
MGNFSEMIPEIMDNAEALKQLANGPVIDALEINRSHGKGRHRKPKAEPAQIEAFPDLPVSRRHA